MAKQELCREEDAENETELDLHPYQVTVKWKELMSTDVEHEQAQYVAREIVTPTAYRRKGNRAVSQPPPSQGRSNQCTSLYFGGNASHWWWPHWQSPIGGKWQQIQQQEVAEVCNAPCYVSVRGQLKQTTSYQLGPSSQKHTCQEWDVRF